MASSKKIQKDDILHVAFEITREKGFDAVKAREIAKRLNTSVQPIFYQFSSMEDLKKEVLNYSLDYYQKFLLNKKGEDSEYKRLVLTILDLQKKSQIYSNLSS